ncbi:hypothetical protein [Bailinhaonella thermotolerans]|uniref:Uncharacterized protein n=1 Tax=Bailinhaonella thermotolerans TaxID=1070861 RepID=A0A3A3ZZR5_9ACTN|nr:hypothetical protein [Bailinhaonella thermotolerans]RJL19979.1 hypothetical protein D5H75_40030 [Bailinhaonella thermotolerans]
MSRTWKDRPWWVKHQDPRMPREAFHDHGVYGEIPCTLQEADRRKPDETWFQRLWPRHGCQYIMRTRTRIARRYLVEALTAADRRRVREACGDYRKVYMAAGDADGVEIPTAQHRQAAAWLS